MAYSTQAVLDTIPKLSKRERDTFGRLSERAHGDDNAVNFLSGLDGRTTRLCGAKNAFEKAKISNEAKETARLGKAVKKLRNEYVSEVKRGFEFDLPSDHVIKGGSFSFEIEERFLGFLNRQSFNPPSKEEVMAAWKEHKVTGTVLALGFSAFAIGTVCFAASGLGGMSDNVFLPMVIYGIGGMTGGIAIGVGSWVFSGLRSRKEAKAVMELATALHNKLSGSNKKEIVQV